MVQYVKAAFLFTVLSIAAVSVLAACGDIITVETVKDDGQPTFAIANHAASDVVIGQPDFTSNLSNQGLPSPGADTLHWPYGNPLLHNGILYMPDYKNNRVLGFNQVPVVNGASADFVIGQPDLTSSASSTAADGAWGAQTMKVHDGRMLLAMYSSDSIYIYNTVPIANGASADVIVGNTGFDIAPANSCTANTLNGPESLFVVDGKLIVADSNNNRVLIWNTVPVVNGAAADIVLGQTDINNCARFTYPKPVWTMSYPSDVWSDGTHLVVADTGNHRVLIWNTFPTYNGQPADVVLGQPDMASKVPGLSDRDMNFPYFLASNGTQLFVADEDNNRVLIWDNIPTQNYTPADGVLGQPDFDCNNANENDGDCLTTDDGPGPMGMKYPAGLLLTENMLIVMDNDNSRAMVFRE